MSTQSGTHLLGGGSRGRYWLILVGSAVCEAGWALALDASEGFTQFVPSLVFVVALVLSFVGLSYALKGIALSVGYAVWTGLGAALTVSTAMLLGFETVSWLKVVFLAGIVLSVVGLALTPSETPTRPLRPPAQG